LISVSRAISPVRAKLLLRLPMDIVSKEILEACINAGDKKAHYALYKACYNYMMSIIIRYSKGNEDTKWLLNQCFSKVVLNLHKYDMGQPFKAWMSRVTVNEILDQLRKDRRRSKAMDGYQTSGRLQVTYNNGEHNLQLEDLMMMLDTLPKKSKMVFNLYAIDGFKHREIAEKLKISAETSKWHLANARKLLQQKIGEWDRTPIQHKKSI